MEGNELVLFSVTSGGNTPEKFNFFGSGNEGYIDAQNNRFYYLKDHLGSVRAVLNGSNEIVSAQDYDMWGYLMAERSYDSNTTKYKFTGKERDRESNYDYFGARYYDAKIGRWGQVEPLLDKYLGVSPYNYTMNNSINYFDPNGESTHTDRDGNVIAVYDDGDLNVYRHDVASDYIGPFKGGKIMGETEFWDEFIVPETGKAGGRILFEKKWDEIVENLHEESLNMGLIEIAENSTSGQKFDIKSKASLAPYGAMTGKLLNNKYTTARSAGNYLAGLNAAYKGIAWRTFIKLAGALHTGNWSTYNAMKIVLLGKSFGPAPWYGEIPYAGRMIKAGWDKQNPLKN